MRNIAPLIVFGLIMLFSLNCESQALKEFGYAYPYQSNDGWWYIRNSSTKMQQVEYEIITKKDNHTQKLSVLLKPDSDTNMHVENVNYVVQVLDVRDANEPTNSTNSESSAEPANDTNGGSTEVVNGSVNPTLPQRGIVGLNLRQTAFGTFVKSVVAGSPAALAGFIGHDQIEKIDGTTISAITEPGNKDNGGAKMSLPNVIDLVRRNANTRVTISFYRYQSWKEYSDGAAPVGSPSLQTITLTRVAPASLQAQPAAK